MAVVGGSIAGCATAASLARSGHTVTVFERSAGALTGRGAGIGTQQSVLRSLSERELIDADIPYFHAAGFPHVGRTTAVERTGRNVWTVPVTTELLNWGDLYSNLRRRVPRDAYRQGVAATGLLASHTEGAALRFSDGRSEEFDLVVFRVGYDEGYCVFYLVPAPGGSVARGERWLNWACYIPVLPADMYPVDSA